MARFDGEAAKVTVSPEQIAVSVAVILGNWFTVIRILSVFWQPVESLVSTRVYSVVT